MTINETLRIHRRVDFRRCDLDRRLESGRREAIRDAARQVGMVFVDDADGEVGRLGRGAGGRGVNSEGETIRDKRQHDRVGADAAQLLDRQPVDVGEVQPQLGEPIAPGRFALLAACGVACSRAFAAWLASDISGLLLPQHDMSGNEVADREERKDERIEPEIRIAEPFGEGADADRLKPGRRKHQADHPSLAGEGGHGHEQT